MEGTGVSVAYSGCLGLRAHLLCWDYRNSQMPRCSGAEHPQKFRGNTFGDFICLVISSDISVAWNRFEYINLSSSPFLHFATIPEHALGLRMTI